jgi:hypothetical protein
MAEGSAGGNPTVWMMQEMFTKIANLIRCSSVVSSNSTQSIEV